MTESLRKTLPQNNSETKDEEILMYVYIYIYIYMYIYPEKRQKTNGDLRLR